ATHSSAPHLGESAVTKMLEYLAQLPDGVVIMEIDGGQSTNTVPAHAFLEIETAIVKDAMAGRIRGVHRAIQALEAEFRDYEDAEFMPPHPTLNLGVVRTQETGVILSGSCRIPPNISHAVYEKWMEDLRVSCENLKGSFRVLDYKKPFRTPEQSILLKGCRDELRNMGLPDLPTTQASTNEASLFHRLDVDCLCFGAGVRENNSHTPNESVKLEDLQKAMQFYHRVIERFCL
ncbi:MAG TPA: M20/M25/M40 family metallo-hydrolase, partial [Pseudobdellovibrionaceae bacterium]|nr:M20/M25/M40 family metallo-hydrolase [Pseudobdellovibrionaceae bacterium]